MSATAAPSSTPHFRLSGRGLSEMQMRRLIAVRDSGDEATRRQARNMISEGNIGLVDSTLGKYFGTYRGSDRWEDLRQVAIEGLLRAAEKYDPAKAAFSTYATQWIRQRVSRALNDSEDGMHVAEDAIWEDRKAQKIERQLQQKLGREVTDAEIAERLRDAGYEKSDAARVAFLRERVRRGSVSLDAHVGDDTDGGSLQDIIADDDAEAAFNEVTVPDGFNDEVQAALDNLPFKERRVVELRFGLTDEGESLTLEEIGQRLSISKQRVLQIETRVVRYLRHKLDNEAAMAHLTARAA